MFFFWITTETYTSSHTIHSLLSLSHVPYPTLSISLLIRSLLPLSPALPAVTAYLCELMIYHLLIRDDYGAFYTALICCWARFSLHSCQLSFRQPANRPVSVSQLQNRHRGHFTLSVPTYKCTGAPMTGCLGAWIFAPNTYWNVRLRDQIEYVSL